MNKLNIVKKSSNIAALDNNEQEEFTINEVFSFLKEQYEAENNTQPLLMSKEDQEACTGTYKYKVLGYRTKYCPQTKKQEHVQRRGWDITEHFVRDLTPEERKSAEEDLKSDDTEEYIQLQMPKSYWEKLIKYIQQSIDEENIVNILKQIKDGKIKLESLSIQTQQKVNYILKAKKSQYVIIIPMDKSLGMDESAIRSKYSLSELKSDIKKRDRRQEYWIYCYNIKIYFYLMLTISLDIVDAHPEYRTHQFVKEMSYLHLGVMDGNQNTASSCSKKERIHVQTQAQDDQFLGENPHKKQKLNSQEQSEVVEGNQNQIAQQQMEPTSPIQTISVFQNDNNQNSVQMEQQQEATNATQQTETKENNQKKLENELNSVISDDIEQKIDMFQKCRAAAVACKEQQECDSFITCVQNQEKLIKIQNMKSTKASYVKNKKVKTFEEVMILHTTIFDSILNVIQNYTQQSKDGIKERSKIKKRLTKHFPQNYFGQYIDKLMQENDNQITQNKQ